MRKPFIAANWKMHLTTDEAVALAEEVSAELSKQKKVDVVLCPSFTLLGSIARSKNKLPLGAQNIYFEEEGAFTGAIDAKQIKEFAEYVIVGHSERRQIFKETDEDVNKKLTTALKNQLTPILCVGEDLKQRSNGEAKPFVTDQIVVALQGLTKDQVSKIVIAYEPIWAIGTGVAAEAKDAEDMAAHIRSLISRQYDIETADEVRVLYGGSIKPDNAAEFFTQDNVDGGLVGGASLIAKDFIKIVNSIL
ncbi:triose-phosphate isomerase [Patescibacteria group bacterium]